MYYDLSQLMKCMLFSHSTVDRAWFGLRAEVQALSVKID